jgi:hypothetical protein
VNWGRHKTSSRQFLRIFRKRKKKSKEIRGMFFSRWVQRLIHHRETDKEKRDKGKDENGEGSF